MGKDSAKLFPQKAHTLENRRNIVELEIFESRRHLRQKVHELIQLATTTITSTEEIKRNLALIRKEFDEQLSLQLLRTLIRADSQERHTIVLLLILLNDPQTITALRHISLDEGFSRSIRLSAALVLAGMGETEETNNNVQHIHVHAMGIR